MGRLLLSSDRELYLLPLLEAFKKPISSSFYCIRGIGCSFIINRQRYYIGNFSQSINKLLNVCERNVRQRY